MKMDTSQRTESIKTLLEEVNKGFVVLPEFQRDFVWELWNTYDLFDSIFRDIFIGSLIYGVPTFELTVREVDLRPRKGEGSRRKLKLQSYSEKQINKMVKTDGFRLLLDGQQRVTSISRALLGIDPVWAIFYRDDELEPGVRKTKAGERSIDDVLVGVAGTEDPERPSVKLSDVYEMTEGKLVREKDKAAKFATTRYIQSLGLKDFEKSDEFESLLAYSTHLQDTFKAEKLISYYLLDTDAEKFALFFERSNSKGLQLNFIDILAAKLYAGFNLRKKIDEFTAEYPNYPLNREIIVRTISLLVSDNADVGRTYILKHLTADHFNEHWDSVCRVYRHCLDYLSKNHFLITQEWMPYENMLAPLMMFLYHTPKHDFSQMTNAQAQFIRAWYWASVFSERYSLAAHTAMVEDAKLLVGLAGGKAAPSKSYVQRLQYQVNVVEDLFDVYKKGSAIYRGVLNLINFASSGLIDWKNNTKLHFNSRLEDHHIFPRDYLRKVLPDMDEKLVDCVLNRTLIPKITNIKFGAKKPSEYLAELENPELSVALANHFVPPDLADGTYDDIYELFLGERGAAILELISTEKKLFEEFVGKAVVADNALAS